MNTNEILSALDSEISRLTQVRKLLLEVGETATRTGDVASRNSARPGASTDVPKRGPGRPKGSTNKATSFNPAEFSSKRGTMSAEGRARIAAAQRARWAKRNESATPQAKPAAKSGSAKKASKDKVASAKKPAVKSPSAPRRKVGRPKKNTANIAPARKPASKSVSTKSVSTRSVSTKSASKTSHPVANAVPAPDTSASA